MIKNFYNLTIACEGINFDSKNKTEDVKLSQASKREFITIKRKNSLKRARGKEKKSQKFCVD